MGAWQGAGTVLDVAESVPVELEYAWGCCTTDPLEVLCWHDHIDEAVDHAEGTHIVFGMRETYHREAGISTSQVAVQTYRRR